MLGKIEMPHELCELVRRLETAGYTAYFVGGCVRDSLLKRPFSDYDITTSAKAEQVMSLFSDCKVIPTGLKHGTVTVIYNGYRAEITTYRSDGAYTDFRHPDNVVFSDNILDDTARRDFTVNALCYNQGSGLLDFHGGISDLQNRIIRCVGVPCKRFKEDALRILRALRFASRLGFSIEPSTSAAVLEHKDLIKRVSSERILAELKGFFDTENSHAFVNGYYGVLSEAIGTKRETDVGYLQKLIMLTQPRYRLAVFFALCGESKEGALRLIKGLKPDNKTVKSVASAADACYTDCFADYLSTAKTVRNYGVETAKLMLELSINMKREVCADSLRRIELIERGELPFSVKELDIKGNEISEKGIAKGADISQTLEYLYDCVHSGLNNEKTALLYKAECYMNERKNQ